MSTAAISHLEQMKGLVADIMQADTEHLEWFRYGATYVLSLFCMVDFYRNTGRQLEAGDALLDLRHKNAAADGKDTIARNMLRLGVYWDENEQVVAGQQPGLSAEKMLDIVRTPLK